MHLSELLKLKKPVTRTIASEDAEKISFCHSSIAGGNLNCKHHSGTMRGFSPPPPLLEYAFFFFLLHISAAPRTQL